MASYRDYRKGIFLSLWLVLIVGVMWGFGPPQGLEFEAVSPSRPQEVELVKEFWEHELLGKILTHAVFFMITLVMLLKVRRASLFLKLRKVILIGSVVVVGFLWGGYLCPTSAVQNIFNKWDTAFAILFIIPIGISVFFGRVFCSTVCPFGALSELVYMAKLKLKIPLQVEKILVWIKYGILAFQVVRMIGGASVNDSMTPFQALFRWDNWGMNWVLTIAFLALSVFTFRPFCRFLCPYGALLGLASKFRLFRYREQKGCVHCQLCAKSCPAHAIDAKLRVNGECVVCGLCTKGCRKDAWAYTLPVRTEESPRK